MYKLTDSMITNELKDTVFMSNENTLLIVILIGITVFLGGIFIFSRAPRQKYSSLALLVLFVVMSIGIIRNNNYMKNAINNNEWVVHTDIVDRVMEETDDDGDKSYFMVLEEYGRVSLDSYYEAIQYYTGAEVYIVVVPKGKGFEDAGVVYPVDTYNYVGNH